VATTFKAGRVLQTSERSHVSRCNQSTTPDDWAPVAFAMTLDVEGDRVVLRLSGDADASVAVAIESALRHAVLYKSEVRDVDVVLGDVTYLDARVVGVLLGIGYELRKQQRALRMVSPSQSAARLFGILGLDRVLDIRDPDAA